MPRHTNLWNEIEMKKPDLSWIDVLIASVVIIAVGVSAHLIVAITLAANITSQM